MRQKPAIEAISAAADLLERARNIAVLTGAGISKESGIPTFRDAQTGIWANFDPQQLATPEGFLANPSLVWQWYESRRAMLKEAKPNPGHYALADLESFFPLLTVITQNIDGLHRAAGSSKVLEIHGSITRNFCFDHQHEASDVPSGLDTPPVCHCGSLVRPAVVWFGEPLPAEIFSQAVRAAEECDLLMVIGTSGLVHPAASIPFVAKRRGAKVIEVNPEETPITDIADVFLQGFSGMVLPALVQELKQKKGI